MQASAASRDTCAHQRHQRPRWLGGGGIPLNLSVGDPTHETRTGELWGLHPGCHPEPRRNKSTAPMCGLLSPRDLHPHGKGIHAFSLSRSFLYCLGHDLGGFLQMVSGRTKAHVPDNSLCLQTAGLLWRHPTVSVPESPFSKGS